MKDGPPPYVGGYVEKKKGRVGKTRAFRKNEGECSRLRLRLGDFQGVIR
jgi:hypothetical protein